MEINATEFKAKCLRLMDEIARTRESITVTKHGKPVAMVVPVEPEAIQPKTGFGCMAGTIEISGNIISPIVEPWSTMAGDEDEYYESLTAQEDKSLYGQEKKAK